MIKYLISILMLCIFAAIVHSFPASAQDANSEKTKKMEIYERLIKNNEDGRGIVETISLLCVRKGEDYAAEGHKEPPQTNEAFNIADQCIIETERMLSSQVIRQMTSKNIIPVFQELMEYPEMREYMNACAIGAIGSGFTSYERDHEYMDYEMRLATTAGIVDAVTKMWLGLP